MIVLLQGAVEWEGVAAAIQAGCTSPVQILSYISHPTSSPAMAQQKQPPKRQLPSQHHHQQQHGRPQQEQQQQQEQCDQEQQPASGEELTEGRSEQQQQPQQSLGTASCKGHEPVVSKEHLMRRLRVWCKEGRLEQVARGRYQIPQQQQLQQVHSDGEQEQQAGLHK